MDIILTLLMAGARKGSCKYSIDVFVLLDAKARARGRFRGGRSRGRERVDGRRVVSAVAVSSLW